MTSGRLDLEHSWETEQVFGDMIHVFECRAESTTARLRSASRFDYCPYCGTEFGDGP